LAYQIWVKKEGIEIELSPLYIYEPNSSTERAGQEIINKAIIIYIMAHLPERLWPESSMAAIYLFNRSPSYTNNWRIPNEVLDS
jgi:hypothetical protein